MPAPESSPLRTELQALTAVQERFDVAYQTAITSGDTTEADRLKQELTDRMNALKEKLNPFESRLRVREQYENQVAMMARLKILETFDSGPHAGKVGIRGIDGQEYPLPSYQDVSKRMVEKKEVLQTKVDQGFVKMLLVPFGMPLDKLVAIYRAALQKHFDEGKLFYTKKTKHDPSEPDKPLEAITQLNSEGPLWVWDQYEGADQSGRLVYHPQEFKADTPGGKTKTEFLTDTHEGFTIRFIEDMPNIPRGGQGMTKGSVGHERAQLDTSGTSIRGQMTPGQSAPDPHEYLKALQTDVQYKDEQGMTPEEQILYALTHLEETDQVIDDYQGNGSISYQLGAYFPASDSVPSARWDRGVHRARLGRRDPGDRGGDCGVRSAVGV